MTKWMNVCFVFPTFDGFDCFNVKQSHMNFKHQTTVRETHLAPEVVHVPNLCKFVRNKYTIFFSIK